MLCKCLKSYDTVNVSVGVLITAEDSDSWGTLQHSEALFGFAIWHV
jgi:hypothetical protein